MDKNKDSREKNLGLKPHTKAVSSFKKSKHIKYLSLIAHSKISENPQLYQTLKQLKTLQSEIDVERKRVRLILNSITEGLFGVDKDYKCTFINKSTLNLLRRSEEECLGQNMHELTHYKHLDGRLYKINDCPIYKSFKTGKPLRLLEEVLWDKFGTPITVLYSCAPIIEKKQVTGAVITVIDVSGYKKTEEELMKNQQRLELAEVAARFGTFELNLQTNESIRSKNMDAVYGYPNGGFPNTWQAWESSIHTDDVQRVREELEKAIKSGRFFTEFRIVWPDQTIHWIQARAKVLYDLKKKPLRMVGVNLDITEKKELEGRKDEFISIASHELKTPVTTIKGYAQILQQHIKDDDKARNYLAKMSEQIERLIELLNDLLDVSKIQSGKLELRKEWIDIDSYLKNIAQDIQQITTSHSINLDLNVHKKVLIDRYRIGEVVTNLLVNAIKYSPKANKVIIKSYIENDSLVVCVEDFGIGISRRDQNKIFERFYQASNKIRGSFSGLGLGLYISSQIVQRHGGSMWVESTKGKGSTFGFKIPIHKS